MKDALEAVGEDERDAEQALDPLLAKDWIHDVGMVDVVEHNGTALGSNSAGEPAADRDANALLDLFLDADCSAGDELVARLVEQQECRCVGLQQVPDPRQQLGQKLLQVEMRKRGVGDELQPPKPLGVAGGGHVTKDTASARLRANTGPFGYVGTR